MKERPILFSGEMVKAILEGQKTQTRRVARDLIELNPKLTWRVGHLGYLENKVDGGTWYSASYRCPYGAVGDRLWVRETCHPYIETVYTAQGKTERQKCIYRADGGTLLNGAVWKPSIFMPRWASRITLEIAKVRIERLQDISGRDAIAEGVRGLGRDPEQQTYEAARKRAIEETEASARVVFCNLWDALNDDRGFGWASNPWVWVVEFKRVEGRA